MQHYEPRLHGVARVLLGPALRPYLDPMDLVQSVHHSLLDGFRDGRFTITTPDSLIALALTLLRRKVARHWRHLKRQERRIANPSHRDGIPQILAELTSPEAGPAELAQHRDQIERLYRRLDRTERQVLALRLDGFTTAEIAEQLGMNHVTLRVRLTRLRERLTSSGVLHDWL